MVLPSETAAPARASFVGAGAGSPLLGVLMIIAGFIALMSVVMATVVSVLIVGVMMILSGVVEIVHGSR